MSDITMPCPGMPEWIVTTHTEAKMLKRIWQLERQLAEAQEALRWFDSMGLLRDYLELGNPVPMPVDRALTAARAAGGER